jgi:glyoxalase family protein
MEVLWAELDPTVNSLHVRMEVSYNKNMAFSVQGIHHITAVASDPVRTVDFYTRILGLRLVKKSVNQDDVSTYHLFFGDTTGEPGMDLTFFTFQPAMAGRRGAGQVTTISLAVPKQSLAFWQQRFETLNVKHEKLHQSFGTDRLRFYDFDDQQLELVGVEEEELAAGSGEIWTTPAITPAEAIRYFYSAQLSVTDVRLIEPVLTVLGYQPKATADTVIQYELQSSERAAYLEVGIVSSAERGLGAAGTVHHIAFSVADVAEQIVLSRELRNLGLYPTEMIDRYYFRSVYFRTHAGILCEIATAGPGFTADEPAAKLGQKLALPPFLEAQRAEIEASLVPLPESLHD